MNGQPIPGAKSPVYIAEISGEYSVEVTDSNGCSAISIQVFITDIHDLKIDSFFVYPNPSSSNWELIVGDQLIGSLAEVYGMGGQKIYQSQIGNSHSVIKLTDAASGIYELRILATNGYWVTKLVKM